MNTLVIVFILFFFTKLVYSQEFLITGKVIDENFNSLAGVIISNSKTQEYETTNTKGNFEIKADIGDSLKFKFVGLAPEVIMVDSKREINLIMIDKTVNCLGGIYTKRDYKIAYRKIDKKQKKLYKEANKLRIWDEK